MLDERKAKILQAVVTEYIETAQPVGSGHVAAKADVKVSPATVRNDMAALEAEGFLAQPHTSAGRIPTEKGYRFFVDQLGGPGRLGASETQQVRAFFAQTHKQIDQMLADTSRLLSSLTHNAAVVVGPQPEVTTVRSVQLVSLNARNILLVVVFSNGAVEKYSLEFSEDVDELSVNAAGVQLSTLMVGTSLAKISTPSEQNEQTSISEKIVSLALEKVKGESHQSEHVFIGGTSQMVSNFDAVRKVSEILHILEEQLVVVSLLEDVLSRGLSVAIGRETGSEALADCALVVAPYEIDGEFAGTIGVLGPTRMHYDQALSAVAVVANRLGRTLSENG
ncbi:MAG: heat-inducible transcription repressor HrcA [Actinomycetota bacterium]